MYIPINLFAYSDLCYKNQPTKGLDEDDAYDMNNAAPQVNIFDDDDDVDGNAVVDEMAVEIAAADDDDDEDDDDDGDVVVENEDEHHPYIATRVIRAPEDIIRPSAEQLQEAADANRFERAQILAMLQTMTKTT
jgi:hypothetical protein